MATPAAQESNGKHHPASGARAGRKRRHSSLGLEPPPKAVHWSLGRQEANGKVMRCFWHIGNQKSAIWPIDEMPPSVDTIAERWGSGAYVVTWYDAKSQIAGRAKGLHIDDPSRPAKATYPNPPAAPREAPAQPAPEPPNPFAAHLAALQSGNPVAMMIMLMQVQQQCDDRAHARARSELELSLQRDREHAQLSMRMMSEHYRATLETVRSARVPTVVERDDEDDEDDEVHDRIDELAENVAAIARRAQDGGDSDPVKSAVVKVLQSIPPEALASIGSSLAKRIAGG